MNNYEYLKQYINNNFNMLDYDSLLKILEKYELTDKEKYELLSYFNSFIKINNLNLNDQTRSYLTEISKYPILSYEELIDLFKKVEAGDNLARKKIIECHLKFVVFIAKKYYNPNKNIELLDLIMEGNEGLIQAINDFNYRLGYRLTTYAYYKIKRNILLYIKRQSFGRSNELAKTFHRIKRCEDLLISSLQRFPSDEEIATLYNSKFNPDIPLTPKMVAKIKYKCKTPISLDAPLTNDDDCEDTKLNFLKNPIDNFENIEDILTVKGILSGKIKSDLTPREIEILCKHFRINPIGDNFQTTDNYLDISRERIRQIESKAFRKLRNTEVLNGLF